MLSKTTIAFIIGISLIVISFPIILFGYQKYNNFAQVVEECNLNLLSNNNTIIDTTNITDECNIAFREATVGYQLQTLGEILFMAGIIIIAVKGLERLYNKRKSRNK